MTKEDIDEGGIGDDGDQFALRDPADFKLAVLAQNDGDDQEQGRAGGKGRGQEAGRQDGGEPEMAARQTAVQKGGDRMDRDGPGDGEPGKGLVPGGRRRSPVLGVQYHPADEDVEEQIAVQHDHVPEQHGVRGRMKQDVEGAHRLAEIGHDEHQAHDHRGDGQKLAEHRDPTEGLVVVKVVWQHQHDPAGGDADQEGELGDVHAPGDIAAHAGVAQTILKLLDITEHADRYEPEKDGHPGPVSFTSFEYFF